MTSPLEKCEIFEQRSVIRFLLAEGEKPVDIYTRISKQYGKSCMNRRNCYKWIEKFKDGRTSVSDEYRCGRPAEVSTSDLETRIESLILEDRRITVRIIAEKLQISVGTAHEVITNKLKYHKTSARWVPRQLTDDNKQTRLRICTELKHRYEQEGNAFLDSIMTSDETWIHHYEPESKKQSMEWRHASSPVKKKFRTQPSAGKVMMTIFWDSMGPVFVDFLEDQSTINSTYYCDMLINKVKPAILKKRPGYQRRGIILLHDNARPHTAQKTQETIDKLHWELLPHPPYSPDLAPSDFHLFGPLKDYLRGQKFIDNNHVKENVLNWLRGQDKSFFAAGINKLIHRWDKCINVCGDYIEK